MEIIQAISVLALVVWQAACSLTSAALAWGIGKLVEVRTKQLHTQSMLWRAGVSTGALCTECGTNLCGLAN